MGEYWRCGYLNPNFGYLNSGPTCKFPIWYKRHMGKQYCLGHGRNVRKSYSSSNLPIGNRRCRGFVDFLDDDDDGDLGDGEGWAEVAGGTDRLVSREGGGAN